MMRLILGNPMNPASGWMFTCLLVMVLFAGEKANAQDVVVRAELSKSVITADESVNLTIIAQGIDVELDASSLNENFDVVGRSSSREVSATIGSNGRLNNVSVVRWVLELIPKNQGVFTVPAVKVGNYETQLLSLTVNDIPQGADRDIFLEVSVDTSKPWVQSQVLMSLKVFVDVEIVDGGLDAPVGDNLTVQRIGEDAQSVEERDGRRYRVTERRFALFPQKSGSVTIEPVTLQVSVPADPSRVRGFFSPTRKLTRRSAPITLEVQARPSSGTAWWLPAKALSIQAQWQSAPENAQVDQPITRTLVMRAQGVLQSQLPEISIPAVEGLSLYAEEPQLSMGGGDNGLVAEQRINWALIPQRSGPLTLPAVRVEWFNTLTGENEIAQLPAETINVALASSTVSSSGANNNATNSAQNNTQEPLSSEPSNQTQIAELAGNTITTGQQSLLQQQTLELQALNLRVEQLQTAARRWQSIAIGSLIACIAFAFWFLRRGRTKQQRPSAYTQLRPLNEVAKACKQGDLMQTKNALLEWAGRQWPNNPPTTLDQIGAKLPKGAARDKLIAIQLALYSKDGFSTTAPWLGDQLTDLPNELSDALKNSEHFPKLTTTNEPSDSYSRLPPL